MSHDQTGRIDRRRFLQAGAAATAGAASLAPSASAQQAAAPDDTAVLPRRKLGKTGLEVTLLEQGAARTDTDRVLRFAFARGIRLFDTARVYGTEPSFKKWFAQDPAIRKQIILVTKDNPRKPSDMLRMVDQRLATLGTDYIDVFFIHGLGDREYGGIDKSVAFLKSPEFRQVADRIRDSGKAKFIGFSAHHPERARLLQAAAEAGGVDVIMLQYRPWLEKESALNRAIDAAWNKGIGLISMKQIANQAFGDAPRGDILKDVQQRVPALAERKLTVFQGLLHAIWTDERISAACVSMRNTEQIRENVDAARRFEPLRTADILNLRDEFRAHNPTLCADCDGRCALAAGTKAELGNLTRFLTYFTRYGDRAEARREYAKLAAEARDWSGADLEAARAACPDRLDFARLLPQVDEYLA